MASQNDFELPKQIGRYQVLRLIGEGAMGRVYCAHDPVLGRDVAVKLLRDDLAVPRDVREGLLARMRNEARAAARVAHPNLVTLHDMGEDTHVGLYLVFEYVEGPTLKQRLVEGPLSPADTARLARELGSGLTCAHNEGILHRDVKPENVILSRTGGKIADFGIARIPNSTLTHAGGLMGTPAYSAPETFGGKNFSPLSDQFSLAALLYEALRGERAFPGDDAIEVAASIAHDSPERFSEERSLPVEVDEILLRAMTRSPGDRFPSCEILGELLADALAPVITPPPRAMMTSSSGRMLLHEAAPPFPPPERRWGQVVLGVSVVTVTAALLVHTALRHEEDPRLVIPTASSASAEPAASSSEKPRTSSSPSTARVPRIRSSSESMSPETTGSAAAIEDAGAPEDGGVERSDGGGSDGGDAGVTSNPNATPALSASMGPTPSAPTSTPSSSPARPAPTASAPTNDARRLP